MTEAELQALRDKQAKGETLTAEETAALNAAETTDDDLTPEQLKAKYADAQKRIKELNKESADRRKRLEALEKAENDRKSSEMTELEKLKAQIETVVPEFEKLKAENTKLILRQRLATVAAEAKAEFVSPKAQEVAFSLLDMETVGEDASGMKEALVKLQKEHSYLFGVMQKPPETDARFKGKNQPELTTADVLAAKRAQYGAL